MTPCVDDAALGRFARQQHDWFERVRKGSLNPDEVMKAIQAVIDRGSLFIPPEAQLALVRQRNTECRWGFTDADFAALGEPPSWPDDPLGAVLLDVSLDTVQQTFEQAWHFASAVQPGSWRWDAVLSDEKHLQLLPGITFQRGLRWQVMDLAANWDKQNGIRPLDVRDPKVSPHSSILWAASYFPKWVQTMDGESVPFVWLPGYQLTVPGRRPWSFVPYLFWHRDSRRVELYAFFAGYRRRGWAVPSLRE